MILLNTLLKYLIIVEFSKNFKCEFFCNAFYHNNLYYHCWYVIFVTLIAIFRIIMMLFLIYKKYTEHYSIPNIFSSFQKQIFNS